MIWINDIKHINEKKQKSRQKDRHSLHMLGGKANNLKMSVLFELLVRIKLIITKTLTLFKYEYIV